jgi:hypothetical protein
MKDNKSRDVLIITVGLILVLTIFITTIYFRSGAFD